jgi:hypothetical protein
MLPNGDHDQVGPEWEMTDVTDVTTETAAAATAPAATGTTPPQLLQAPQPQLLQPQPRQPQPPQPQPPQVPNMWFFTAPLPPLVPVPQLQSFRYNRLGAGEFPSAYLYLMPEGNVIFSGNRHGGGGTVSAAHGRFYWTFPEVPWKWEPWWNIQRGIQPGHVREPVLEVIFNSSGDTTKLWRLCFYPQHYPPGSWFCDSGTTEWSVHLHQL